MFSPSSETQGLLARDDAIFSGESLLQELESPWEPSTLTEPVPEVVEFRPAVWPENIFLANQRDGIRPLLELVR